MTAGNDESKDKKQTLSDIIADIPECGITMPASLSMNTSTTRAPSTRAEGDIMVFNADEITGVKAAGWQTMQQFTGNNGNFNMYFEILQQYAAQHMIVSGVPFSLGTWNLPLGAGEQDMGKALIHTTNNGLVIFWHFTLEIDYGYGPMEFPTYFFISMVSNTNNSYITVNMEVYPYPPLFSDNLNDKYKSYITYDKNHNEDLIIYTTLISDSTTDYTSLYDYTYNNDGSLTGISKTTMYGNTDSVIWGNDTYGGIITNTLSETEKEVDVEYYNNMGDLIYEANGTTILDHYRFDIIDDSNYVMNIYDLIPEGAPDNLYFKEDYSSYPREVSYSFDNITYTPLPGNFSSWFHHIWKSGTQWTTGDVIYDYIGKQDIEATTTMYTYIKEYQVSEKIDYLGEQYYFDHNHPLNNLLPLSEDYSQYNVVQIEGETYSDTWQDLDGEMKTWFYTDYEYFIDINGNRQLDQSEDIVLNNLDNDVIYYLNYTTGKLEKTRAPFFSSSGTLPPYFEFKEQATIDAVKAKLTEIYNTKFNNLSFDDYDDRVIQLYDNPGFLPLK